MIDCKAMTTPMASNMKLLSDESLDTVDAMMYRRMIIPCEHIETCSLDGCKACSEVLKGYN